jgi:hypothetical protein
MMKRFWPGVVLGAVLTLAAMAGGRWLAPTPSDAKAPVAPKGSDRGGLVASFGVGGVLTRDGELWQYRPDREKWVTLDESFALEGEARKFIPLPVPASDVKMMETFGFIVTWSDECWLYDLDQDAWTKIGAPPFHATSR